MTSFRIEEIKHLHGLAFVDDHEDPRLDDWPVVYTLSSAKEIYVGESVNVRGRFLQHLKSKEKQHLTTRHVIIDDTFNKSAALDLESHLVRLLSGDGQFKVVNRNDGIVDADYFDRASYRKKFELIFKRLHQLGVLAKPVREIENSQLFKFSPFKALSDDQAAAARSFLMELLRRLAAGERSQSVIQGSPGTGKTIVGIYLIKLLADLGAKDSAVGTDEESFFNDPFIAEHRHLLEGFRMGLVIPQQALRRTVERVFAKTPGLKKSMVLTPFQVGEAGEPFDLLIVDETHRLNRRANQGSATLNRKFSEINKRLHGADDPEKTQLDWIVSQSRHQIFLLDAGQSVRPADLAPDTLKGLVRSAKADGSYYPLSTQMRVASGEEYINYIRGVLSDDPPAPRLFPGYDLRWFEDASELAKALDAREAETGLARMTAGYAWPWKSKKDPAAFDIEIDGLRCRWNSSEKDWVNSPDAAGEVGSIHTVQGYDLNYAGVIIGPDLRYDPELGRLVFDRANYFDKKGKENSPSYGVESTDEDLLRYVLNVYVVLLTRGILGTYVYVCDPALRERLRGFFRTQT